jgi:Fumarase
MPKEIIEGFAYLKKAAAYANAELGVLPVEKEMPLQRYVMKS